MTQAPYCFITLNNNNTPIYNSELVPYYRPWSRNNGITCINNLPNNNIPCNNININQLDMRRKAEILKYKNNSTNKLTKAQKYSLIANNRYNIRKRWATQTDIVSETNPNIYNLPRINNILLCKSNNRISCNSNYSSDVPGKQMLLYYDPNIPLINYGPPMRTYLAGNTNFPQYD